MRSSSGGTAIRIAPLILAAILIGAAALPGAVSHPFSSPAYADDDGEGRSGGRNRGGGSGDRDVGGTWDDRRAPAVGGFRLPRLFGTPRVQRPRVRPAPAPPPPAIAIADEIVVADISAAEIDLLVGVGFVLVARAPLSALQGEVARLTLPPDASLEAARERILAIAPAAAIDLNHLYRPVEMPCRLDDCPAFAMIDWPVPPAACALEASLGMIDTTVNLEHEALRDRSIEIVSVLSPDERESAAVHGTAIAALLVGNPASRTPGLLPSAELVAIEAFHRDATGDAADVYKIVRSIDRLAERGVRVASLSFTGPANVVLERTVGNAQEAGIILIAAAGNAGPKAPPAYPGAYAGVIAVTAVDRGQRIYRQASRGSHIDFAAPGVRIWTAASISGGRFRSGTSYAVPFVSAAIAAILAREPERDAEAVVRHLSTQSTDLGESGHDAIFGWGLVNAAASCDPALAPAGH